MGMVSSSGEEDRITSTTEESTEAYWDVMTHIFGSLRSVS